MDFSTQNNYGIAYPTIITTFVAIIIYITSSLIATAGDLDMVWAVVINTVMAYVLFTPMHEAGHYNISGNNHRLRWLNEGIGWISGIPLFAPFSIFRIVHFRHHAHTNDPDKDPDHWLASSNLAALVFHAATIFPVYLIKGGQLLFHEKKVSNSNKRELRQGFIVFLLMFFVLIMLGISVGWFQVLWLWVVPAFLSQVLLAIAFDWLPHHPHEELDRYRNTRVFDFPGLSYLLLGQNYHLVHHLYPRIPFYDYEKVYRSIRQTLKEKGTHIIPKEKAL